MDETPARRLILLGPQPQCTSLALAMERLGCHGPAALITAGWQDEEKMDSAVLNVLTSSSVNLHLFQRSEILFEKDAELIQLLRQRQDELRILRDGYRLRLDRILDAARQILEVNSLGAFNFLPECELAIDQLRQLDRQYFVRTSQVCDAYEQQLNTASRPLVVEHRKQIADTLGNCDCLVIAGGHAAIILNRLRIFGVLELAPRLPVIAWSAGTMVLADQIVLFHDSPPQGAGNPEVQRAGLALFHEFLPLPNARRRLNLGDQLRVSLFSRRFQRYKCVELNERTILDRNHGRWDVTECNQLSGDGSLEELGI